MSNVAFSVVIDEATGRDSEDAAEIVGSFDDTIDPADLDVSGAQDLPADFVRSLAVFPSFCLLS